MSELYQGIFGDKEKRKAPCPECERPTRVKTLFEKLDSWHDEGSDITGVVEHYAFECMGCETVFFAKATANSEDYNSCYNPVSGEHETNFIDQKYYWPSVPSTRIPDWVGLKLRMKDTLLFELFQSVYKALNSEMPILAAIGMRTALDRTSILMGISPELSFEEKLELMRKKGHISGTQKGFLEVFVEAGSAAAHRGWKPEPDQLATMLRILEVLVEDLFFVREEARSLRDSIPSRSIKTK